MSNQLTSSRRFNHSAEMFDELLLLGAEIGQFLEELPQRCSGFHRCSSLLLLLIGF